MTDKQRQLLLAFLGYDPGPFDGLWGSRSRRACAAFQKDRGLPADGLGGERTDEALRRAVGQGDFWQGIRYWTREEFRCQCGGKYCTGFPAEPDPVLVRLLEKTRQHFGRPGLRSSGLRCEVWNALCGGVATSRHKTGKAMDFRIEGISGPQVLAYLQQQEQTRYAYDIDGTYVHVDVA